MGRRIEADMEGGETPQLPYQVIPEKKNDRIGNSMMGSAHTYDLGKRTGKGGREAAVELALNPEEVDMMDTEAMALRAEALLENSRTFWPRKISQTWLLNMRQSKRIKEKLRLQRMTPKPR